MTFNRGDYVTHTTFPPVEGVVCGCESTEFRTRLAVMQSSGSIYWDDINTWTLYKNNEPEIIDADDLEIIDAEFVEIVDN